jgi:EspA/EspE family
VTDLAVSPEYLTSLSKGMNAWVGEALEPAMAAVPGDWTADGIRVAAAAGSAILGAAGGAIVYFDELKGGYDKLMATKFDIKGLSKGSQAYQAAWVLADLYTIYSKMQGGDYWGAALAAIGMIPRFMSISADHYKIDELFADAGGTTQILDYTGYALTGIGFCFGVGVTDKGEDFTRGAGRFGDGGAALRRLMPESDWQGAASTGYGEKVTQLQKLMADMAAADTQMANILQLEEDQLEVTRNIILTANKVVAAAVPVAMAIYLSPELGGPAASNIFQTSVSVSAFATAVGAIGNQLNLSYFNGEKVKSQQLQYSRVQTAANSFVQTISA